MALKESATHHKEKSEILLVTRPPTCFLILACEKGQKEDKSEFVTKSAGVIVTIIFM